MGDQDPRRPRPPPRPATIGIFALSGSVDPGQLDAGILRLETDGHRVVLASEARRTWRYFAGTDAERLAGFDRLLRDPAIDVMLAARGGYGITRLLAAIDWERVGASGKLFAGFSDFTAFNCAALAQGRLATAHAPMLASDLGAGAPDDYMLRHFSASVWGAGDSETVAGDHGYPSGSHRGLLWGGNLSMLTHLVGTDFLPVIDAGLLYVEEIAEEPYAIERMFLQLHHAGVLGRQSAILLGDFSRCVPDNPLRYPYAMDEVIETLREIAPCPVLAGLPFGHVPRKLTLPFGLPGVLSLDQSGYSLSWPGFGAG